MSDDVKLDMRALDNLSKAILKGVQSVKVGILGEKTNRETEASETNASIGLRHEFGTVHMPRRSFLREPLNDNLQAYLDKTGLFTKEAVAEVIKGKTFEPWAEKIAITAVQVVSEAFDSGGFGKWKPSDMSLKENQQTLVETQQLRNSIAYEVKA